MKKFLVELEEEQYERLRRRAFEQKVPMIKIIRLALLSWFEMKDSSKK